VTLGTKVPGAGGAPQGAAGTKMVGAGVFGSAASGDAASTPGSLGAMSPWLPGSCLPGSFGSVSLPVNCRQVENEAEFVCSQVATAERLLHDALASFGCNILRPVWVSLRKGWEICQHPQ
jgi:hypothetical protein